MKSVKAGLTVQMDGKTLPVFANYSVVGNKISLMNSCIHPEGYVKSEVTISEMSVMMSLDIRRC